MATIATTDQRYLEWEATFKQGHHNEWRGPKTRKQRLVRVSNNAPEYLEQHRKLYEYAVETERTFTALFKPGDTIQYRLYKSSPRPWESPILRYDYHMVFPWVIWGVTVQGGNAQANLQFSFFERDEVVKI